MSTRCCLMRLLNIGQHLGLQLREVVPDMALGGEVPDGGFLPAQAQDCGGPGLAPAAFDGPGAPADVRRAGPGFPTAVVEGTEPGAVEAGQLLGAGLNAAQILGELVFGALQLGIAGGANGFMQPKEGEAGGVELVGHWIAVLLEERGFARAVIFVALRGAEVTAANRAQPLMDRAGRLLPGEQVAGYPGQPLAVLRGVFDAHEPGQTE